MVTKCDPTITTLNTLRDWNPRERSEVLEVATTKMPDGKVVHYLEKGSRPHFFQWLANKVRTIFGKGVSWELNNVTDTVIERMNIVQDFDATQQAIMNKFLDFVAGVNQRHAGKVSDESIKKLTDLCRSKTKEVDQPLTSSPGDEKEPVVSEQKGSEVPASVSVQQEPEVIVAAPKETVAQSLEAIPQESSEVKTVSQPHQEPPSVILSKDQGEQHVLAVVTRPHGAPRRTPPTRMHLREKSHHQPAESPAASQASTSGEKKPVRKLLGAVGFGMNYELRARMQTHQEKAKKRS